VPLSSSILSQNAEIDLELVVFSLNHHLNSSQIFDIFIYIIKNIKTSHLLKNGLQWDSAEMQGLRQDCSFH